MRSDKCPQQRSRPAVEAGDIPGIKTADVDVSIRAKDEIGWYKKACSGKWREDSYVRARPSVKLENADGSPRGNPSWRENVKISIGSEARSSQRLSCGTGRKWP